MSDDRSERLRRQRNQVKEKVQESRVGESEGPSDSSEASKLSETSKPSKSSELSETSNQSVKEQRVGTYMYLPENQQQKLSRLYNLLKAEYEFEFESKFEKNRHFYPLVIEHGIQGLDGLDPSELKESLDSLDIQK